jgi:NADH dehydrogenase
MRPQSICILGGTGFVGGHLAARLIRAGHAVRILTRNRDRHRQLTVLPGLELQQCEIYDANALAERFRGCDAVINLVGILNESGRSGAGFRRAHVELTRTAVAACHTARISRFLQMSALGASLEGPSHYLRSKAEAERFLRTESALHWTIFQPSVICGAGDSFMNRFAGLLRVLPLLPLARADARFSPVCVDDVVDAFYHALADDKTIGETYQLCGPEVYTLRELVLFARDTLGLRRPVFGLPDFLGWLQALVLEFIPGKPLSTDNFRSLTVDNVCTNNGFARLGIVPGSLRAAVPLYLGESRRSARYDSLRRAAGRQ